MTYRPDIDGLRAVAVLSVIFYHADLGLPGGFVGVDVFFVISGYLITGLVLNELDESRFSLAGFWERRIRRIMPPLVLVSAATMAGGWWLLLADDYKELGQSLVSQVLMLSNVFFWRRFGYFELGTELKPLLHTWSLAVEEQFYLLFPIVLVALNTWSGKRLQKAVLLALLASFALGIYWSHSMPEAGFYLLPARAWQLLLGALLAMLPDLGAFARPWLTELMGITGLGMIICALACYDGTTSYPGVAALLPTMGAVLLIGCGARSIVGRWLAQPWLVGVGLVSYSLYLWHWPLLVFSRYWAAVPLSLVQRLLLVAASGVLALLSWKWVEQPFRRRTFCGSRQSVFFFATVSTASLFLLGFGVHHARGIPSRIPEAAQLYADGRQDCPYRKQVSLEQAMRGDFIMLGSQHDAQVRVLVWGDSHAMALLPVIEDLCQEKGFRGAAAVHYQTAPLVNYQNRGAYSLKDKTPLFSASVVDFVRRHKVPRLILTAAWNDYLEESGAPKIKQSLQETISMLRDCGASVWIMEDVPIHAFDVPRRLSATALFGGDIEKIGLPLDAHRAASLLQHSTFQEIEPKKFTLLDPAGFFLNAHGLCRVAADGRALYTDGGHLSGHGSRLLRPLLLPVFE